MLFSAKVNKEALQPDFNITRKTINLTSVHSGLPYQPEEWLCVFQSVSKQCGCSRIMESAWKIKHDSVHRRDRGGSGLREMNIYRRVALLTQNELTLLTRGSRWSLCCECVCVCVCACVRPDRYCLSPDWVILLLTRGSDGWTDSKEIERNDSRLRWWVSLKLNYIISKCRHALCRGGRKSGMKHLTDSRENIMSCSLQMSSESI